MAIIPGTPGNDNLPGTSQDDLITGLEGNDSIAGNAGNDLIYGNQGNDLIDIAGGAGAGSDTIFGGQGNDQIGELANKGADLVYGNLGDDHLDGGEDNDTIFGGQGNDIIRGFTGNDVIYGNLGNDSIAGGFGDDTLFGGQDLDVLVGGDGNDIVYGNLGDDIVRAQSGNDTIFGGQGNDIIISENGDDKDRMFGNLGADTFDFSTFDQTPPNTVVDDAHSDRIADFVTGVDKILLDISDFADNTPDYAELSAPAVTTVAGAIAAASNASAINGQEVIFVAGTTDGYLLINANGDASIGGSPNEFAIVLEGKNNLNDFASTDLAFVDSTGLTTPT